MRRVRGERRRYQAEVARLLERIESQSQRARLLAASGVGPALLAQVGAETERTRQQLAALVRGRRNELANAA
ncbi:MAG: hypothetical protein ACRDLK_14125 [Gaiellaceae bacterium]